MEIKKNIAAVKGREKYGKKLPRNAAWSFDTANNFKGCVCTGSYWIADFALQRYLMRLHFKHHQLLDCLGNRLIQIIHAQKLADSEAKKPRH